MKPKFIKYLNRIITAIIIHFIVKMFDRSFQQNILDFGIRGIGFFVFCIFFILLFWILSDILLRISLKYVPTEQKFIKHISVLFAEYLLLGVFVAISFSISYALFDKFFFNVTHYHFIY